jgi:hypothetical protein
MEGATGAQAIHDQREAAPHHQQGEQHDNGRYSQRLEKSMQSFDYFVPKSTYSADGSPEALELPRRPRFSSAIGDTDLPHIAG